MNIASHVIQTTSNVADIARRAVSHGLFADSSKSADSPPRGRRSEIQDSGAYSSDAIEAPPLPADESPLWEGFLTNLHHKPEQPKPSSWLDKAASSLPKSLMEKSAVAMTFLSKSIMKSPEGQEVPHFSEMLDRANAEDDLRSGSENGSLPPMRNISPEPITE
jgi:hypothetical protein